MTERLEEHHYLWDPTAPPHAEIEHLERALSPLRYQPPRDVGSVSVPSRLSRPTRKPALLAMAAAIMAVFLLAWLFAAPGRSRDAGWSVNPVSGVVRIDADLVEDVGRLEVGQSLQTDAQSRTRIDVADIGSLDVHPNSRLRLLRSTERERRLALDRGRIDAMIYAPPRLFFVDTPSAVAVDLGCAYSLVVDDDGGGRIEVSFGWVALEAAGLVSTIPTDGVCSMHPEHGPGTPYFSDAPSVLVEALQRYDFEADRADAVDVILRSARPRDTLTLWHLLPRVPASRRSEVADRIVELGSLPSGVSRDALGRLDAEAMDRTWSLLERTW